MVTTEEDTKPKPSIVKIPEDENGRVNDAFEKTDDRHSDPTKSQQRLSHIRPHDSRNDRESRGDQEPREHTQNFENGRALRDSRDRYREIETLRSGERDTDRKVEETRITYKSQDIYQRPIDEIDTPRFPTEYDKRDPIFAKIINPSVKIMRVERDIEEALDSYRWFVE